MSDGTEQDQTGQAGGGSPMPRAGASADPVWPVWGGTPPAPAQDPEPTADTAGLDETPTEPEPTAQSDPADESDDAAAEPVAEPDVVAESDPAVEPDPVAEPAVEPQSTVEPETVAEPEPTVEPEAVVEPEPTIEPEATVEPAVVAGPEATVEPEVTAEPEATAESEVAAEPEATPEPEVTPEPQAESEVPIETEMPVEPESAAVSEPAAVAVDKVAGVEPSAASEHDHDPEASDEATREPGAEPEPAHEPVAAAPQGPAAAGPASPSGAEPSVEDATEVLPPVIAASAATAAAASPAVVGPVVARTSAFAAPVAAPTPPAPAPPGPTPPAPTAPPAPAAPPASARAAAPVAAQPVAAALPTAPTVVAPPVAAAPPVAPTVVAPPAVATPASSAFAPVSAAAAAASSTIQAGRVPSSERTPSPFDVFEPEDRRRRWPRRLAIVGGIVLVLCAGYVAASFAVADKVPRGASVAGVDIGGLTSADAVARLESELADDTTQPIPVAAQDSQATLDPTAAGLTFDAQATVDQLTGLDLANPKQLLDHLLGVDEQPAVTAVDSEKLAASIEGLGTALQLAPVDGTIVYVDATAQSTDAVDGWELDPQGSAKVIADGWLAAPRPLTLPTTTVAPAITQEKTDAALVEASKVTSAPVSVMVEGQVALLDAATLAANATYVPTDGNLTLQLNGDGLTAAVLAQLPTLLTASADAHFEFVNDAPTIIPGTPGTTLDPKAVAAAVATAAVANDRSATVGLVPSDPSESTAALEALGVKEIVSEFSTPLTSEPRRTVNITNGANKINGTLIKPGETFSLTEALGPIDAAHGFVEAGAIVSGEHTDAWGGGLSQVSTTSYNAGFLAGFEDIEHKPHSEWFSRYPEGREATIFTGTLDMRWKNNTPYGALVQAWVADNRVYVRVWGTKYWTVESITSPRTKVVQPTTVYSQSPTCEASGAGNPGFAVTVTRKTSLNGELVKTESNSWRYKPQNKIVCGPAPAPPAPTG